MSNFLVYWRPDEATKALGNPSTGSWSRQYEKRIDPGDTLWVISFIDDRLQLVARQIVERVNTEAGGVPEVDAREPIDRAELVDIHAVAPRLRFEGNVDRLPEKFGPKNFQTIRKLTGPASAVIDEVWRRARGLPPEEDEPGKEHGLEKATSVDDAKGLVLTRVLEPALSHKDLEKEFRNKIANTKKLVERFRKTGDLLDYLGRFADRQRVGPLYDRLRALGLTTFEDLLPELERDFGGSRDERTSLSDFIIGERYTSWDLAIFSRTYSVQSGIYLIGPDTERRAIFIKATLGGEGKYPNEWIVPGEDLKYYLKSISGRFSRDFKDNDAIVNSGATPIYVFDKVGTTLTLEGIFRFANLHEERDGSMWFRLVKRDLFDHGKPVLAETYWKQLGDAIVGAKRDDGEARRKRLANARRQPRQVRTYAQAFQRNPDVIVEVLARANGYCERCRQEAPFRRARDGTPYLEVHHAIQLALGGSDTVENALALCPNCHRELHHGLPET